MQQSRYQRIKANYSAIAATLALVIAVGTSGAMATGVFVTSKQIKNGTILSADIKNNQVKSADVQNGAVDTPDLADNAVQSPDIAPSAVDSSDIGDGQVNSGDISNGSVSSADIGNGEVKPDDLDLPAPKQIVAGAVSGPVSAEFTKLADIGSYSKETGDSVLQVEWTGAVGPGPGTNCVFQLRVNGNPSMQAGGEVFAITGPANVASTGLWTGLGAGPANIEVWAKLSAAAVGNPTCVLDPSNPGIASTFVVAEVVQ